MLIVVLIFMAVLAVEFGFLVKGLTEFQKINQWRYSAIKVSYLAQSGFAFADSHFQSLPLIVESSNKETLYTQVKLGVKPMPDKDVFLVKSSQAVYSMGMVNATYRALFKRAYTKAGETLVWGSLEKL